MPVQMRYGVPQQLIIHLPGVEDVRKGLRQSLQKNGGADARSEDGRAVAFRALIVWQFLGPPPVFCRLRVTTAMWVIRASTWCMRWNSSAPLHRQRWTASKTTFWRNSSIHTPAYQTLRDGVSERSPCCVLPSKKTAHTIFVQASRKENRGAPGPRRGSMVLRRRPHVREQHSSIISDAIEDHELWGKKSRGNPIETVLGMRRIMVGEAAAWQQGISRYGAEHLEEWGQLLT
jgi:hypothetical protein